MALDKSITMYLTIGKNSPLGPKLTRRMELFQRDENRQAKQEGRDPRTITLQEVIIRHCCEMEGVEFTPNRPGRRW